MESPRSIRLSIRSRTGSLCCARWRATDRSDPPWWIPVSVLSSMVTWSATSGRLGAESSGGPGRRVSLLTPRLARLYRIVRRLAQRPRSLGVLVRSVGASSIMRTDLYSGRGGGPPLSLAHGPLCIWVLAALDMA